jgi:2-polyprenyl-3-methyl-5-hydroxy-6-metoxy-1,4-benzoquinol methylase
MPGKSQDDLIRPPMGSAMATTSRMGSFYNEKRAAAEMRKYRKKGPIPSTRTLIEALKAEGVEGATLLDIGGGIGAIQHALLAAGVAQATSVDASAAYLDAAGTESDRRVHGDRVTYRHGDFVELAESVPPADIVTLDRVINVYPDWDRLVALSAERAQRLYGLVYPRDRRMVRLVIFVMNLALRVLRKPVRASVHPAAAIERVVREQGLSRHFSRSVGAAWQVAVYRRL